MKKEVPIEKEKIIRVTAALFGEKGYAATSVRDIAQALDASIAMIYYYFKNKEEVLFSILEASGGNLAITIDKAVKENGDPLDRVRRMLFEHICAIPERKNWMRVFVEEQGNLSKKHQNIIYKQHRRIYDIYNEQLRELKKLNLVTIDEKDFPVVVFAMLGMANWTYRWYREGRSPIEDVARTTVDLFCHGILNHTGLTAYAKLAPL